MSYNENNVIFFLISFFMSNINRAIISLVELQNVSLYITQLLTLVIFIAYHTIECNLQQK